MPRVLRLTIAALAALLLTQCAFGPLASRTASPRGMKLASLGYEPLQLQKSSGDSRYSGKFKVNGKGVHFLIDSGANSTDLDYELATSFGIKPEKSVKVISRGALGRPVTSWVGLGALGAGYVTATPFPFMLAPHSDRHTATSRYDGQMGLDALTGLAALVDLQTGQLWIP
ncbi:MAG: aspartyl protease family protein, partial [Akkermansiaceae bacterium]